jgi:hypothetical protein
MESNRLDAIVKSLCTPDEQEIINEAIASQKQSPFLYISMKYKGIESYIPKKNLRKFIEAIEPFRNKIEFFQNVYYDWKKSTEKTPMLFLSVYNQVHAKPIPQKEEIDA